MELRGGAIYGRKWQKLISPVRFFLLIAFIVFGVMAIIGSSSDSSSDNHNDDTAQSHTVNGLSGNQVKLNGSWSSGCSADIPEGESETGVLTFSGSNFTNIMNEWDYVTDCSDTSDATFTMNGTFVLVDEVMATWNFDSVVIGTRVDGVINSYKATVNNPNLIPDMNRVYLTQMVIQLIVSWTLDNNVCKY